MTVLVKAIVWDEESTRLIEDAWGKIMMTAQAVVKKHEEFGFELIATRINPKLEDILHGLKVVQHMMELGMPPIDEDPSLHRQVLNAKQQIVHIEMVAMAVKIDDRNLYDNAINAMKKQALF